MSELLARLQGDLNSARKSQDKAGTLLLSTVLSEIKNKKIELRREPADADVIDVLRKSIKRRRESVEMYTKGGRKDLADKETAEATALEKYLPAQVSEDELRTAVRAAIAGGATQIGAVMGKVLPQYKGRADGSTINAGAGAATVSVTPGQGRSACRLWATGFDENDSKKPPAAHGGHAHGPQPVVFSSSSNDEFPRA